MTTPVPLVAARARVPGEYAWRFLRDPLDALTRFAALGDLVTFGRSAERLLLVNHPEHVREVLVTNQRNFKKGRALERARLLLGDGLLTAEGDEHRRHRRMLQPGFHRQHVLRYGEAMVDAATRHAGRWTDGQRMDMHREMSALALVIAGTTLFGADVAGEASDVATALEHTFGAFMRTFYLPGGERLLRLPLPSSRKFWRATALLESTVYRLIAERRASGDQRDDLLSLLLAARDDEGDGTGLTDRQVRDEAMTFFLAGHETTANALTWTWLLLARHPEVADRLAEESTALGAALPTADDLPRLPYARMVLSESMRIFPPAWMVARRALGPFALGGHEFPAETLVLTSPYLVHRDARWWPDPLRFDPERWEGEPPADRPRFAWFPFGGGARMCIGEHFAWLEGILVLATIAREWRFTLEPDAQVRPQATITLRPRGGIAMRARRRHA